MFRIILICIVFVEYISSAHVYGPYKVGNPYKIGNDEYIPAEVAELSQSGVASWYGKEFEGKPTANGAVFKADLYTAAHRTLPMPSAVLITNITNNKKVIAIVNDRGPFSSDKTRIVDVSKKVAEDLGFTDVGRANVKIEYLPSLSQKLKNNEDINLEQYNVQDMSPTVVQSAIDINKSLASASTIGSTSFTKGYQKAFYVQVGVFEVLANAQKVYQQLANTSKIQLRSESHNIKNYYIVRAGPFEDISHAEEAKSIIQKQCGSCQAMIVII